MAVERAMESLRGERVGIAVAAAHPAGRVLLPPPPRPLRRRPASLRGLDGGHGTCPLCALPGSQVSPVLFLIVSLPATGLWRCGDLFWFQSISFSWKGGVSYHKGAGGSVPLATFRSISAAADAHSGSERRLQ